MYRQQNVGTGWFCKPPDIVLHLNVSWQTSLSRERNTAGHFPEVHFKISSGLIYAICFKFSNCLGCSSIAAPLDTGKSAHIMPTCYETSCKNANMVRTTYTDCNMVAAGSKDEPFYSLFTRLKKYSGVKWWLGRKSKQRKLSKKVSGREGAVQRWGWIRQAEHKAVKMMLTQTK